MSELVTTIGICAIVIYFLIIVWEYFTNNKF